MKKILILTLLTGCSLLQEADIYSEVIDGYQREISSDYQDYLQALGEQYQGQREVQRIEPSYLRKLTLSLSRSNELFFKNQYDHLEFFLVDNKQPFHMSTPPNRIFFSKKLLSRYIENEHFLAIILAYEMIRLEKMIYPKRKFIYKSSWAASDIIDLTSPPLDTKTEMNKWIYFFIKRAGYDQDQILTWIQLKNRNYLDFSLMIGDSSNIFKEESSFKEFLVREIKESGLSKEQRSSSSEFYQFIRKFK